MDIVGSGTLHHTCFIVEDVEKTARQLKDGLSIKPWGVWTITPESCFLRGESVDVSFKVAIAPVGNANYELIQPLSGRSIYAECLTAKGPGFHHTCIAYPSLKEMRDAREALEKQGRELLQSASLGDLGEFCYFDLPEMGSCLELLYLTALPRPDLTIE